MPKVGDRVVVEGSKVGGGRREGTLRKVVGSLIQVRWEDGSETLFAPGAGTVQFLPAGKTNGNAAKKAAPAKKASSTTAAKGASKAPARQPAKTLAKKTGAGKAGAKTAKTGAKKAAKGKKK